MIEGSVSTAGRAWRSGRSQWRLYATSLFALVVAFVCLCSSLLVVVNLQSVQARWARSGRATIYLRDGATTDQVLALQHALEQTSGVARVRYIAPEDARNEVASDALGGALASLPDDAFPASLELEIGAGVTDASLASLADKLRSVPCVDSVETYQRWTERIGSLLRGGVTASAVLAAVVLGAVISVIATTIRLAMHRRRTEVEILKLVGATDRFVRGPFVLEGAAQGAAGAGASIALLGILYVIVRERFDGDLASLLGITPTFLPWPLTFAIIALGACLGAVAALSGIRRVSVS
jgi:cell division transport system permease protein